MTVAFSRESKLGMPICWGRATLWMSHCAWASFTCQVAMCALAQNALPLAVDMWFENTCQRSVLFAPWRGDDLTTSG